MAKLVSGTYGDALFELAVEENRLDSLYEEVRTVAEALRENPELSQVMNHPQIDKEDKVSLIENIFKGRISDELVGFMRLIVLKGHFQEINGVFSYYEERVKEYKNIGTAYVTSAMELTGPQKDAVEKRLLETTGYVKLEMHYALDASLIGGMVIRIRDRVVDSSIKTKLFNLTRDLKKLKVGECAP